MTVKDIKISFIINDITQADIARRLKVTDAAVCRVISGKTKSKRIQEAIAHLLNKEIEELWPQKKVA